MRNVHHYRPAPRRSRLLLIAGSIMLAASLWPPAAAAAPVWIACATEDQVCRVPGTRTVRFGSDGKFTTRVASDAIDCSVAVFGDPNYGFDKWCDYDSTATPAEPVPGNWTRCASEGSACAFSGTQDVRFGADGKYAYRRLAAPVPCTVAVFGDPHYGVDKFCDYGGAAPRPSAWSALISFPIVPVAAANLPDGRILTWSADRAQTYTDDDSKTYSAVFDPRTLQASMRIVAETGHDMFCPGISLLQDGRILVSGGDTEQKTSIYNPTTSVWSTGAPMQIPRGYQTNVTLSTGAVLSLGGSWSGQIGGKHGEIWTAASGWRLAPGISITPLLGPDPDGPYRGDNHLWLFPAANGKVFHAGPSAAMHWIDTAGNGSVTFAGNRGDDAYSMNGNTVMYDIGKILKTGGAPAYELAGASAAAYRIDIGTAPVAVTKLAPMNYARAMHNSVVLPNGQVVITGGQTYVKIFSDELSVLMAELWDPQTGRFTTLSPMTVPRNYHSVAILLPDGRVLVGGGGLCDFSCSTNHLNAQILTPPYLLNADGTAAARAAITAAPASAASGQTISVTSDAPLASFALMRLASVTHSINSDQRRVPLRFSTTGTQRYSLIIPADTGTAPKGLYMLFGLDARGVPTVSRSFRIL